MGNAILDKISEKIEKYELFNYYAYRIKTDEEQKISDEERKSDSITTDDKVFIFKDLYKFKPELQ